MNEKVQELFQETLRLSAQLRPEYPESLGKSNELYESKLAEFWHNGLPGLVSSIYASVSGTECGIQDQRLMDFTPGYRLIHIDELSCACSELKQMSGNARCFPLLANYSGDYICILEGSVCGVTHDDPSPYLLHKSEEDFLTTQCEFYRRGVYFLDGDGYLDYDPEKEGIYGSELNPEVPYWSE